MSTIRRSAMLASVAAGLLLAPSSLPAQAADASAPRLTFGAFVDAYYAYDAGRPLNFDRAFTTQAARANEFNVNLAHVEMLISASRVRGRLALQAGTSVQANYGAEAANGAVSGPLLARHLQEAYAGYQLNDALWVDAGIFFSNMGAESWISSDNLTYTRSVVAEYSPYYSTGVRAVWQASPRLVARLDVINGWQNISETNTDKAVGTRLDFTVKEGTTVSHYLYAGTETDGRQRNFTGITATSAVTPRLKLLFQVDVGQQGRGGGGGTDRWNGGVLVARWAATEAVGLVARGEWYRDPAQVIIVTGVGAPFRATGGSVGLDVSRAGGFTWRTEVKALGADAEIFPDRAAAGGTSRTNLLLVSAFTLRM
jgi:hypothetical protein